MMTTLTVKIGANDVEFKKNAVKGLWENTAGKGGYLDTQLGIFRLSKLVGDTIKFLAEFGIASGKGIVQTIADAGVTGTTFVHFVTTIPLLTKQADDAWKNVTPENVVKTAKNVADTVASWMFVGITFAGKAGTLLTPAKLVTFLGDACEGYTEWKEWGRILRSGRNATGAITTKVRELDSVANGVALSDEQNARVETMNTSLKQLQTYQMLKMGKVVASVAAGVLFAAQFVPVLMGTAAWGAITATVSAYVPGAVAALWTTQTLNVVNATLSLASSAFAVSAHYYKQSMKYHIEVKPAV